MMCRFWQKVPNLSGETTENYEKNPEILMNKGNPKYMTNLDSIGKIYAQKTKGSKRCKVADTWSTPSVRNIQRKNGLCERCEQFGVASVRTEKY